MITSSRKLRERAHPLSHLGISGAVAALSLAAIACGGSVGSGGDAIVTPVIPQTISVTSTGVSLDSGQTATLTAVTNISTDAPVAWTSGNPMVASVVATGARTAMVTAISTGVTDMSAALNGVSSAVTLTVRTGNAPQGSPSAFIYSEQGGIFYLPLPATAKGITALAVNDAGQVVGEIQFAIGSSHAFLWSKARGMIDLGALPGSKYFTRATAISPDGQVAGWGTTPDAATDDHAFRWTPAGGMVDIGVPAGMTNSHAAGINSSGEIVGYASNASVALNGLVNYGVTRPFTWTATDGWHLLAMPGTTGDGQATAVNESGAVTGFSYLFDPYEGTFPNAAVMWTPTGEGSVLSARDGSTATSINLNGAVGGIDGTTSATWAGSGSPSQNLPIPSENSSNAVTGINANGLSVGWWTRIVPSANGHTLESHGFFWKASAGFREIPNPWSKNWVTVTGVNNLDQIVGYVQ